MMEQAFQVIALASCGIEEEIEEFACGVVSEIGGFPGIYAQCIKLLRSDPSVGEIQHFMES